MLITRETAPAYAKRHAGGKGQNLYLLSRAGFSVPRWVVLGDEHFVRYREPQEFKRGDLIIFPAGLSCTWEILKDVEKHYNFG